MTIGPAEKQKKKTARPSVIYFLQSVNVLAKHLES